MNLHGITTMTPVAHMFDASTAGAGSTAAAGSSTAAGSGNSSTNAADQAESTFISLLVTELQSQDPTQPMDPTTMVGQMFSMNQLEQLININQTLSTAFAPLTGGAAAVGANAAGSSAPSPNSVLTGGN
ncbi:MAG TPA: flagellar hook capping FlgD N-terminal domain-containing protein [Terriglobales bacterium]|jgi:flagellar basal-body rod modification protein FlgD|nr:flagellar hook capping FlgD N-terminal domain-containing protein [Terriglobales bacterium]